MTPDHLVELIQECKVEIVMVIHNNNLIIICCARKHVFSTTFSYSHKMHCQVCVIFFTAECMIIMIVWCTVVLLYSLLSIMFSYYGSKYVSTNTTWHLFE